MRVNNFYKFYLFVILCCSSILGFSVENSIIPVMEKFEQTENLPKQKYSKNQYQAIVEALSHQADRIRLVTYNMLLNTLDHKHDPINRWPNRLPRIVELLNEMQPDIIGVQELYTDQLAELQERIGKEFAFYGLPSTKENNGIFYRRDRFEFIDGKVWHIPEAIPSWMQLTMVQLKDCKTNQIFAVFNTHLTFPNPDKRESQAQAIAKYSEEYAEQMPVLVMGDLNTFPNRPELDTLPYLDGDYVHRILASGSLKETQEISLLGHVGPIATYTNQIGSIKPFQGTGTPGVYLDHVYASPSITVLMHAVQSGTVGGHFPSDHMPVIIDFIFNTNPITR